MCVVLTLFHVGNVDSNYLFYILMEMTRVTDFTIETIKAEYDTGFSLGRPKNGYIKILEKAFKLLTVA